MIAEAAKDLFKEFRSWVQKDGLVLSSDQDIKGCSFFVKKNGAYVRDLPSFKIVGDANPKGFLYSLQDELRVVFYLKDLSEIVIEIPIGFRWDGASIPKQLQDRVSPEALILPSLVHDFLYGKEAKKFEMNFPAPQKQPVSIVDYNQHDGDILFLYLSKEWTRETEAALAFLAVQTFGESHFKNNSKAGLVKVNLTKEQA